MEARSFTISKQSRKWIDKQQLIVDLQREQPQTFAVYQTFDSKAFLEDHRDFAKPYERDGDPFLVVRANKNANLDEDEVRDPYIKRINALNISEEDMEYVMAEILGNYE